MSLSYFKRAGSCVILLTLFIVQANARPPADSVTNITIKAIAGLQYDLVRFTVQPGAKVNLTLSNTDDMSHNLLITKPGAREQVVKAALDLEEKGPSMDYIPESPQVLWSIPVIAPGENGSVTFTAPEKPGIYPYVCTFPGHGYIMYGAMYVSPTGVMPEITADLNIPPSRRQAGAGNQGSMAMHHAEQPKSMHPYEPKPPYLYRTYMEDASPAAIAVNLPQQISYCWDAGTSRLRYAWEGGFVDSEKLWKGKPNAFAEIKGTVFFKDNATYPIRIGNAGNTPEINFKGYRLINRYPEFHYTYNGKDVFELIHPKEDGTGIVRTFRIPGAGQDVYFYCEPEGAVEYHASAGTWHNGRLKLSSQDAEEFTVTITMTKRSNL